MFFSETLKEGAIVARPNRFLMDVLLKSKRVRCHCPSTGRIGDIRLNNIPCLLSAGRNPARKTKYTVEAISVDDGKSWIGINQGRANDYIHFFLVRDLLPRLTRSSAIQREVKIGSSRIDFVAGNTYIEVKTPLIELPAGPAVGRSPQKHFNSFDRLIKHFSELSKLRKRGGRAVLLMCYLYDAPAFKPPKTDRYNSKIKKAAEKAVESGVETWQVNLKINRNGVQLVRYFRLNLFG